MRRANIDYTSTKTSNNFSRSSLSWVIVIAGNLIIGLLAFVIILYADNKENASQWVFNATVPLIASWVGTVIAFYFGRENLEAATAQALALTRDTLDDLNVSNIMIHLKTIVARRLEEKDYEKVELSKWVELYKQIDKDRIPIFSTEGLPKYIIHRSTMSEYVASHNKDDQGNDVSPNLKQMLEHNKNLYSFKKKNGFVTVSEDTPISKAIEEMKKLEGCKDIFITENGKETGKVKGWLTDTLISRFLTV